MVDGLNQRETPLLAVKPVAGSDFRFFAADPDFQVVCVDDPLAYPHSASRYRQTVVLTASDRACYAVSVFEVKGGSQHDQLFHAASGRKERWALTVPTRRPPPSLLPTSITFLPSARPEQGRWFVQSYGEFRLEAQASLTGPSLVDLADAGPIAEYLTAPGTSKVPGNDPPPSVRLHLLGDNPMAVLTAISPDPIRSEKKNRVVEEDPWRASLVLRRHRAGPAFEVQVRDSVRAGRQGVSAAAAGWPRGGRAGCRRPGCRYERWPGVCARESEPGNNPASGAAWRTIRRFRRTGVAQFESAGSCLRGGRSPRVPAA